MGLLLLLLLPSSMYDSKMGMCVHVSMLRREMLCFFASYFHFWRETFFVRSFFFIYFYNKNTEILMENISLQSFFTRALKQEICLSFIKFLHTITFLTHNNLVLQVTSHTCVRPKIWAVLNIHHRKLKLILSFSARSLVLTYILWVKNFPST